MIDGSITFSEELQKHYEKGDLQVKIKLVQSSNVYITLLVVPIFFASAWLTNIFILEFPALFYFASTEIGKTPQWTDTAVSFWGLPMTGAYFFNWYTFIVWASIFIAMCIPSKLKIDKNRKELKQLRSNL